MTLLRLDTQRAYLEIRERIIKLELLPGAAVDEAALAEQLGLETGPIREAFQWLLHDGLVVHSGRGLYVSEVNWSDLEQLSELRVMLEPFCAQLAAERAVADDLAVLEALVEEHNATDPGDPIRLLHVDQKFHRAVAEAAGNRYLIRALEQLLGPSQRFWYLVLPRLSGLAQTVHTHLDLVRAIKSRDRETAGEIMRSHVEDFTQQIKDLMPEE